MTINIPALIFGIIIAFFIIKQFISSKVADNKWAYPILLATFPVYYWVFSIYAADYDALVNEVLIGMAFIIIASLSVWQSKPTRLIILSIGFIAHAVYDIAHTSFNTHSVAPTWWPEFCGSIDGIIGLYVLWQAYTFKSSET